MKNLRLAKLRERQALPSLRRSTKDPISGLGVMKGADSEFSSWEMEIPTSACFRARESLAPSPQKATRVLEGELGLESAIFDIWITTSLFWIGDILANTFIPEMISSLIMGLMLLELSKKSNVWPSIAKTVFSEISLLIHNLEVLSLSSLSKSLSEVKYGSNSKESDFGSIFKILIF